MKLANSMRYLAGPCRCSKLWCGLPARTCSLQGCTTKSRRHVRSSRTPDRNTTMSTAAELTLNHKSPETPAPARTILYLDVLRAAAIFLVLLTHTAAPVLKASPLGSVNWLAACIYNAASRCCVPLFVMI